MKKKIMCTIIVLFVISNIFTASYASYKTVNTKMESGTRANPSSISNYVSIVVKVIAVHVAENGIWDKAQSGSGFFTQSGYIVTCAHTMIFDENYTSNTVVYQYSNRKTYFEAQIVYFDAEKDLCILRPVRDFVDHNTLAMDFDYKFSENEVLYTIGFPGGDYSIYKLSYEKNMDLTVKTAHDKTRDVHNSPEFKNDSNISATPFGLSGGLIVNTNGVIVGMQGYASIENTNGINIESLDDSILKAEEDVKNGKALAINARK